MLETSTKLSIIIPNWNGKVHLKTCLSALVVQKYHDFEVILVDNGSVDGSIELVKQEYPLVRLIIFGYNKGFAAACNAGIMESEAEYIVLLNNDTKPYPEWLSELVSVMDSAPSDVACLSSKMLNMVNPELIDDTGDILTWRGGAFKRGHGESADMYNLLEEVMLPCAGAALYKRLVLKEVGALDETFFAYLEDVDLGLKIRLAGYKCLFVPKAIVLHVGHGSSLAQAQYVFLTSRNRIFLFFKNIPIILLVKHIGHIIYGWLFFLLAHSDTSAYLRGTFSVFKHLPGMLNKRKMVRSKMKLSNGDIDALLSSDWPEISLGKLFRARIQNFRTKRQGS
jgi:GT2 family glycosyltransferase